MCFCYVVFFFNDKATTEIYTYLHTPSLHDALPISQRPQDGRLLDDRFDDQGRPVGRLQRLPHGQHRRERRQAVADHPRGAGRVRRWLAEQGRGGAEVRARSEEHTSELQSLMRISYAVFCWKKKKEKKTVLKL